MNTTPFKNLSFLENIITKTATVQQVRTWKSGSIYEVDVHIPDVQMDKWDKVQRIKCRVAPYHFVDYTPASWMEEDKTFTLYIDAAHKGRGSHWAKSLQAGDSLPYAGIHSAVHTPGNAPMVFLGDQTAIGHFCALRQLAGDDKIVNGCLMLKDVNQAHDLAENCPWLPMQSFPETRDYLHEFNSWWQRYTLASNAVYYLAGNSHMVAGLRKSLKEKGIAGSQIKAQGFWN